MSQAAGNSGNAANAGGGPAEGGRRTGARGGSAMRPPGLQDEPVIALPRDVSRTFHARVLDPERARRGPGAQPVRPTAYLGSRLLVRGLPGGAAADRIANLAELGRGLKRPIKVEVSAADRAMGPLLSDGPGADIADRQYLTRVDLSWEYADGHPDRRDGAPTMDAWEVLATARSQGAVGTVDVHLDHLMSACGYWGGHGDGYWGGEGYWGGHSTEGYWGGNGYWGGHGSPYGRPGFGPGLPVALHVEDPAKGLTQAELPARSPVVAMLDTGIGTHPWFADRTRVRTISDFGGEPVCCAGSSGSRDSMTGLLARLAGHGTFVAGIVRQACPQASMLSLPVMGCGGAASEGDVLAGLNYLLGQHLGAQHALAGSGDDRYLADIVDVISLSMGYYHEGTQPDADAAVGGDPVDEAPLRETLRALGEAGVLVVAAAGNDATDTPLYPAGWGGDPGAPITDPQGPLPVVSVGALNPSDGTVAMFSNGGDWVSCYEPGAYVVSTIPVDLDGSMQSGVSLETADGMRRSTLDIDDFGSGFAVWSGTSFAAPLLAGAVARRLADEPDVTAVDTVGMRRRAWRALVAELDWGTPS